MYSSNHYPEGHLFFAEGSSGNSAYIIKSGRVEITTEHGGREIVITVFGNGEIFGEMALLGTQTRTATARAIERTEVIEISRRHMLHLLREGHPILRNLVLTLVGRLQQATVSIPLEKADDVGGSVCRLLALMATQKSNAQDESQGGLIPYLEAIKQIQAVLSIDAADCQAILEKLTDFNLIDVTHNPLSTGQFIRLVDEANFLEKAKRALQEFELVLSTHLIQRLLTIDLYDLSEQVGVTREQICQKIGEGQLPVERFFFKKADVLTWAAQVGPSFFEAKKTRISTSEELDTLDGILHVKNAIVRAALSRLDFHQTCLLLKTASDRVKEKILGHLPGRLKQTVLEEVDLIEVVDADEVEEAREDFLDEIRDLMDAEKAQKGGSE